VNADLKTQIGERVRRIRRMRNFTQKELADRIVGRLDYTYIGRIERGAQLPSLKVLDKLSDALTVPLAYFFREESLSHLLPEELRRLSRDETRTALLREVARVSRGDIPLLLEIVRLLRGHRATKGIHRRAVPYAAEQRMAQRAAESRNLYRRRSGGSETELLREAIGELDRFVRRAKRSRLSRSQRAVKALERARRELRRSAVTSS
jgi:transcriptional regulator with XRE-family HTH domain